MQWKFLHIRHRDNLHLQFHKQVSTETLKEMTGHSCRDEGHPAPCHHNTLTNYKFPGHNSSLASLLPVPLLSGAETEHPALHCPSAHCCSSLGQSHQTSTWCLWSLLPCLCWPLQNHKDKWTILIESFCDLLLFLWQFWSVTGIQANRDSPQESPQSGSPRGRQIHGAFQVLVTQKGLTITTCASPSPWLNILFSCNPQPLSSADSGGAVSALCSLASGTQAVCGV